MLESISGTYAFEVPRNWKQTPTIFWLLPAWSSELETGMSHFFGVAEVDILDWKEMLKRAQDLQLKLRKRLNQRAARSSAAPAMAEERGQEAPHHPAAAQDHGGVKEVGDEETVSGPDNLRRPSGCASAPQTQRRPGHSLHQGSSYADQHLGQLAEAEAHQRSRAGQPAIPLLLEAAQPARAGRRCCRRSSSTSCTSRRRGNPTASFLSTT